jgi:hypothetical protein
MQNDHTNVAELDRALVDGDYDRAQNLLDGLAPGSAWGEHPRYPFDEWKAEAARGDTRVGYLEWLRHRIEFE